jgi:hypothetical protein
VKTELLDAGFDQIDRIFEVGIDQNMPFGRGYEEGSVVLCADVIYVAKYLVSGKGVVIANGWGELPGGQYWRQCFFGTLRFWQNAREVGKGTRKRAGRNARRIMSALGVIVSRILKYRKLPSVTVAISQMQVDAPVGPVLVLPKSKHWIGARSAPCRR